MKSLWEGIGKLLFWLGWPAWFLYFKMYPVRSRVLIIADGGHALLVKGWLGDGKWSLPGGGVKPGETVLASAIRELREEVGLSIPDSAFEDLGEYLHKSAGLHYKAHYFIVKIDEMQPPSKQWPEIADARWYKLHELRGRMLSRDAAYALKRYVPPAQGSLL